MTSKVKQIARQIFQIVAPSRYASFHAARSRRFSESYEKSCGCDELTEECIEIFGSATVQAGPFKGLEFPSDTHHRHLAPKLLGSYEHIIHSEIEDFASSSYQQILDVGSAEGYYAVGLARLHPDTQVVAFDTDWWARDVTRKSAALNGSPNVEVVGACTPTWLNKNLRTPALIVLDCEGYEFTLANPDVVDFSKCDLLIEVHPKQASNQEADIASRFQDTHDIDIIDWKSPVPDMWASHLPKARRKQAVCEYRTDANDQYWLVANRQR